MESQNGMEVLFCNFHFLLNVVKSYALERIKVVTQRKNSVFQLLVQFRGCFSAENLTKKVLTCLIVSAVLLKIDTFGVKL